MSKLTKLLLGIVFLTSIATVSQPLGVVFPAPSVARIQTLADWQAVKGVKGCAGIPYSNLRGDCETKRRYVEDYCKSSSNPYSCDGLGTKGLLEAIQGIKGEIERLKSAKEEANKRRSDAKTDDERREAEDKYKEIDDKLYRAQGRLEDHERRVNENKRLAERYVYNGEKCRDARVEMQSLFKRVIDDAARESDKEIKEIAQYNISNIWEPENKEHENHIKDYVLPAIDNCKACVSGDR